MQKKQARSAIFLLVISGLISSCSYLSFPGVYKIDIEQGHLLNEETLSKLKPGMSKSQVVYLLGNPLLTDTFHRNRWDYHYSIKVSGKLQQQKHLVVYFLDDLYHNHEVKPEFSASPD